ncbi:MAG TPA: hypothetical protein PKD92_09250, partial [Novosphingobium sp.]|nr:hypothetical protein [Novosphingobium sp.]
MERILALALLVLPLLSGCIARTVVDVATAPVKVAGKAGGMAPTRPAGAAGKTGPAPREREGKIARLGRRLAKKA